MFDRLVALITTACLLWGGLVSTGAVWAQGRGAPDEQEDPLDSADTSEEADGIRTIVGLPTQGWSVVDIRQVKGKLVVLSPLVGREIDLAESNRYSMFHGRSNYNQRVNLRILDLAVPGFQSAVFLKRPGGKPAVRVQYRSGPKIESRSLPLKDDNTLRLIREYVERFDDIRSGTHKLGKESSIEAGAEYPMYTEEEITFEVRRPRFGVRSRIRGELVLKDGNIVQGEFVPVYEDGRILIETGIDTRRVPVTEIDRLRTLGDRGSGAMKTAVVAGVGAAASGALIGALAAWQAGGNVKETAMFVGAIFGGVSFVFGLLRGSRSARGSKEFVMGPLPGGKDQESEEDRPRE